MPAAIEIKGVEEVMAKLGRAAGLDVLQSPMQRALYRIEYDIKVYPPPAKQRDGYKGPIYRRGYGFEGGPATSERLRDSWTTKITRFGGGLRGAVGTNVSYAPYVQHDRSFPKPRQTLKHIATGWITDKRVIEQNARRIIADFEAAIARALK